MRHVLKVPNVSVLFVSAGETTRRVKDVLTLDRATASSPPRLVLELLRFANRHLAFQHLLITRPTCFVSAASLIDIHLEDGPLVGSVHVEVDRPFRNATSNPVCLDEGYLLQRETASLIATWPNTDRIDELSSGAELATTILRWAGGEPVLKPGFTKVVDPTSCLSGSMLRTEPENGTVLCPSIQLDPRGLRAFFERSHKRAEQSPAGLTRGGPYFDRRFVQRLARHGATPQVIRDVARRNHPRIDDFAPIEKQLAQPGGLKAYIEARDAEVRQRIEREYQVLARPECPEWPYDYLRIHEGLRILPKRPNRYADADRLVTFIFCIKNRSKRVRLALRSLLSPALLSFADVMVVEDQSDGALDLTGEPYADRVAHIVVDTQISWTRAGLLNFGARQATTPLVAACDADFLFPPGFADEASRVLRAVDFDRHLFAINCFETETHRHHHGVMSRAAPYGYQWIYDRAKFLGVHGFDERFVGWGHEERELEERLKLRFGLSRLHSYQVAPELRILHLSHSVRSGDDRRTANEQLRAELRAGRHWMANPHRWGDFPVVAWRRYAPKDNGDSADVQDTIDVQARVAEGLRSSAVLAEQMTPSMLDEARMSVSSSVRDPAERIESLWSRLERRARWAVPLRYLDRGMR